MLTDRHHFLRFVFCCGYVVLLTFGVWMFQKITARAEDSSETFRALQTRLAENGFNADKMQSLFQKPSVHFEPRTVSLFFIHSEARVNYGQFLSPESIQNAREYMQNHLSDLNAAEQSLGVCKEVVVAIMLVETRLGTYLGNTSILNTLSSLAALKDPELRQVVWDTIRPDRRPEKAAFEERAKAKSAWAFQELKAFLTYTARENLDPTSMYGSYAGAMGISQFMPSNILTYALDGNHDGRIDLFDPSDAIMSIANYLKHFGWKPGISPEDAYDVVYNYNHSQYYVNTVLKITDILKGQNGPSHN